MGEITPTDMFTDYVIRVTYTRQIAQHPLESAHLQTYGRLVLP